MRTLDVTFGSSLESTEDEERAARAAIFILFTNFLAACWARTTSRSHAYRDTESTVYTLSSDEYHDVRRSPAMLRIRSVVCVYAAGAYTHPGAYIRSRRRNQDDPAPVRQTNLCSMDDTKPGGLWWRERDCADSSHGMCEWHV